MAARGIAPPQPPDPPAAQYTEPFDREFAGHNLTILPGVFEPGSSTLGTVDELLMRIKDIPKPVIADVGTGSGAIAITVALQRPDATVYALDISDTAAECAARNAASLNATNVHVFQGSLLEPLSDEYDRIDAISAHLPWVPRPMVGVKDLLRPDHWRGPPHTIVGTDGDGLGLVRELMRQSTPLLKRSGCMVLEIADWQCALLAEEFASSYASYISPTGFFITLSRRSDAVTPGP